MPPTLIPAIETPAGIRDGDPAKTAPKSAASASTTATAAATACQSTRERERLPRVRRTRFWALADTGTRVATVTKARQNTNSSIPPLTLSSIPVI